MSSSQQFWANKKLCKTPERSNFAHTCNLLSQYVKEKGGLKELNLVGLGEKLETSAKSSVTSMNEIVGQSSMQQTKPIPQVPRFATRNSDEGPKNPNSSLEKPKTAQLTIFYEGKVMVFDDFPPEKAREILQLASTESSDDANLVAPKEDRSYCADAVASSSEVAPVPVQLERAQPQPEAETASAPSGSDLPIARRSSLHRFLGKRKERNVARGPYNQAQNQNAEESSSSKDGASSSKYDEQLELKL